MLSAVLKHQLARFERRYDYDSAYMRDLVDADAGGAMRLALVSAFTDHRFGLPAEAYFAAKVTAAEWADCGACLRLAVAMGVEAGVPRADIAALLAGTQDAPPAMRLARRYARAAIAGDPDLIDLIEECAQRWGRNGVAGLAAATVSGVFYPLFKRGLGYGNACEPVLADLRAEAARRGTREMDHA